MRILDRVRADFFYLRCALRALNATGPIAKNPTHVFPQLIDELAERHGEKPALISDRETLGYRALAERSHRYARWALVNGVGKGDTVCLLMPNRPEYMAIWIGISRVGGVTALLNTHLVGPTLAHCIDLVRPKHVIAAGELLDAMTGAEPYLKTRPQVWAHGETVADLPRIDHAVTTYEAGKLTPAEQCRLTVEDKALYIYTSGTTGLPKAANVNHYRIMLASLGFAAVMDTKPTDRMYDCLPMYHTAGGVVATGALLANGGSVVIREKFSAREFWDDVVRHDCTLFQYIGELCRYLVNSPPHPNERKHWLRLCCGNGLRPDIWNEFKARFAIPRIVEFYGATEGNVMLFNFEGHPGAVGRIPWFVARRFPVRIVKLDAETQAPVRDARGFCVRCAPDEIGETIGRIVNDPAAPSSRFEGYADAKDNEAKILRNAFERGDAWFRTGDLMRQDADGYFYFVDRVGDTFRWKGENVSTTQVCEALTVFPGITDACVYGVPIPGYEGRAGMAAMVCGDDLDLAALHAHLATQLPDYARPLFLRIRRERELTASLQQKKIALVAQCCDPAATHDRIFFNDGRAGAFVPIDAALYRSIVNGDIRLTSSRTSEPATFSEVLAFWRGLGPDKWFEKDDAIDGEIRRRFLPTYEAATTGRLAAWEAIPEGALALVLVLDQFPRNMFRGDARAFAADGLAREAAERAIAHGFDRSFANPERRFFYLPFMHAEDLAEQERCIALCRAAGDVEGVRHAENHADIIRRFGRFPHRNAALGRHSTPEEAQFLAAGGFAG